MFRSACGRPYCEGPEQVQEAHCRKQSRDPEERGIGDVDGVALLADGAIPLKGSVNV